jgi:hypothetical protein
MRSFGALALLISLTSCDFNAAVRRYCAGNPACASDASADSLPDGEASVIPAPIQCSPSRPCQNPHEICHPFGWVCLRLCNSSNDCPAWHDACTEIKDPMGTIYTPKVCTCSTALGCDGYARGFACNLLDSLCEKECADASACEGFDPPRVCDQLMGICVSTIQICLVNAHCTSPDQARCDPISGRCVRCIGDADCSSRADGFTRCNATGVCVPP